MTIWPPDREDLKRPAYRSLADCLIRAVEAGEMKSGDRLQTHRELSDRLGLSVQTISRAYEELTRRGFVTGEVGRGTFVRTNGLNLDSPWQDDVEDQNDSLIDCSILKPVSASIHMDNMRSALSKLSDNLPASVIFSFRPTRAQRLYHDTAVTWLALCGIENCPETVQLTNGNTSAMTVSLMTSTSVGDLIVTEQMGHHTLKHLTRYLGLRLKGLETDEEGILPEDFEHACVSDTVKALYVMPSGLNPLARMMGIERREALCRIARKYDVLLIENDAWGPIQPGRPQPLAALAPERTFYFTSFTKCIMPGLRSGYLIVPEILASAAANSHLVSNWMATPMLAEIASRWIRDGTAVKLLEWQMKALGERNKLAAKVLGDIPFHASPNGLHIWLPLPASWEEESFVTHARLHGVAIAPGSVFAISETARHSGVRICLGVNTDIALERGLGIIARLIRSQPEPALLGI
ncbi:MAG: DNA-binding transcriptional MocR family regulator [Planctomycetota bacterium]|jgi:DNA-binding transcriptional MocR family regulator